MAAHANPFSVLPIERTLDDDENNDEQVNNPQPNSDAPRGTQNINTRDGSPPRKRRARKFGETEFKNTPRDQQTWTHRQATINSSMEARTEANAISADDVPQNAHTIIQDGGITSGDQSLQAPDNNATEVAESAPASHQDTAVPVVAAPSEKAKGKAKAGERHEDSIDIHLTRAVPAPQNDTMLPPEMFFAPIEPGAQQVMMADTLFGSNINGDSAYSMGAIDLEGLTLVERLAFAEASGIPLPPQAQVQYHPHIAQLYDEMFGGSPGTSQTPGNPFYLPAEPIHAFKTRVGIPEDVNIEDGANEEEAMLVDDFSKAVSPSVVELERVDLPSSSARGALSVREWVAKNATLKKAGPAPEPRVKLEPVELTVPALEGASTANADSLDDPKTFDSIHNPAPATGAGRAGIARKVPVFAETKIRIQSVLRTSPCPDGMPAGARLTHLRASSKATWAERRKTEGGFGVQVFSIDDDYDVANVNPVRLHIEVTEAIKLALPEFEPRVVPAIGEFNGPSLPPGTFNVDHIPKETATEVLKVEFIKIGRLCLIIFDWDNFNSSFMATFTGALMNNKLLSAGLSAACIPSPEIKNVFRQLESRHPGTGVHARKAFADSIFATPISVTPRGAQWMTFDELNVYGNTGSLIPPGEDGKPRDFPQDLLAELRTAFGTLFVEEDDLGRAVKRAEEYRCAICASLSHPTGKCPALGIEGWPAPKPYPIARRGRGGLPGPPGGGPPPNLGVSAGRGGAGGARGFNRGSGGRGFPGLGGFAGRGGRGNSNFIPF
ncbi:hypothetical protein AURDEDRAFT_122602 [Auricularia subglabra TFB-10046 SS5]|nr:hypothetical protein AURDEDRAFT_122602 [Auricularia subglabra TFB-10046 SS5]